jgi:outer membrane protein TolC
MALYKRLLIPRSNQALEVTRSAFEAGKANFTDFIDSQRMLLAFQLEYQEAVIRRVQRLAELEMLTGEDKLIKSWKNLEKGDQKNE